MFLFSIFCFHQIIDNLTWAQNIVEEILSACRVEVITTVDNWVIVDGQPQLPPGITTVICPDACNSNGTCENGVLLIVFSK